MEFAHFLNTHVLLVSVDTALSLMTWTDTYMKLHFVIRTSVMQFLLPNKLWVGRQLTSQTGVLWLIHFNFVLFKLCTDRKAVTQFASKLLKSWRTTNFRDWPLSKLWGPPSLDSSTMTHPLNSTDWASLKFVSFLQFLNLESEKFSKRLSPLKT
jgi:hypothetical protein